MSPQQWIAPSSYPLGYPALSTVPFTIEQGHKSNSRKICIPRGKLKRKELHDLQYTKHNYVIIMILSFLTQIYMPSMELHFSKILIRP